MISMQRTFGHPVMVPPGNTARITCPGVVPGAQTAAYVRDDVMHVRVTFDRHEFVDLDRARHADAAQVVAFQIDQHDVLGALLGMLDELAHARGFVVAANARTRAGDRARLRAAARTSTRRSGDELTMAQSSYCSNPANGAGFASAQGRVQRRRRDWLIADRHAIRATG